MPFAGHASRPGWDSSLPNPRVRHRVQDIRQKVHCHVGQADR
jgi:hypothetical protein